MLAQRLEPLGCELAASEDFGLPAEAKEAAAFALLAWQTWHHLPGNVPAATGAAPPGDSGPGDVCVRLLRWHRVACDPWRLRAAAPRRAIRDTVVFLIESSPANLDPRVGTDAQSAAHRRVALRWPGGPRCELPFHSRIGRALGAARSAYARLSSARRRSLSRWPLADQPRRAVDHRFHASRVK